MPKQGLEKRTHAFISSQFDYCFIHRALKKKALCQPQLIQNTAKLRNLTIIRLFDNPNTGFRLLRELSSKPCSYVHKSLHGSGLKYISDMFLPYEPSRAP